MEQPAPSLPPKSQDELLVRFDEQGNLLTPATRAEIHQQPLRYWHAVANVWVVNRAGQILCSRRSEFVEGNPGKWQTYFGGHVKQGHTFLDTAVAELREEIGIEVERNKLGLIAKNRYEPAKHFYESYAYLFDGKIEDLTFPDGEIVTVKWLSPQDYRREEEVNPEMWCNRLTPEDAAKIELFLRSIGAK